MKYPALIVLLLFIMVVPSFQCRRGSTTGCFKGRLEVMGICMNYTIKVLEGRIDTNVVQTIWVDPQTGIRHENVFRLNSVCNFPATIKQGDEFYFTTATSGRSGCVVCMAYYPTPGKGQSIVVLQSACP